MFKIGLIGTENSHALAFAKYFNLSKEDGTYNEPDDMIAAIKETMETGKIVSVN